MRTNTVARAIILALGAIVVAASSARADEVAAAAGGSTPEAAAVAQERAAVHELALEPRIGWFAPSSSLRSSPTLAVAGGYHWDRQRDLWLLAELGYAQPSMNNAVAGAAPGEGFRYRLTAHDVGLFLGARKRFASPLPKLLARLQPFADAGLKLHLLYTTVAGATDNLGGLGRNHESTLIFGLAARGGAMYRLGPGALSLGVEVGYARYTQTITGKVHVFDLAPTLGYWMQF